MAGEEIAICTLIVSFGPFITSFYFYFTILILVIIIAVMEVLKESGFIASLQRNDSSKSQYRKKSLHSKTTRKISVVGVKKSEKKHRFLLRKTTQDNR